MARNTKQRRSDRSPSPIDQYYQGKISAAEYVEMIARTPVADQVRRESERRVRRILRVVERTS